MLLSSPNSKSCVLSGILMSALICGVMTVARAQSTSDTTTRLTLRTEWELNSLIYALCRNASDADLVRLKSLSDKSVSLAAAWEETRRAIVTRHEHGGSSTEPLRQFVRFVEDRLKTTTPVNWAETVLAANITSQGLVDFPKEDVAGPYRDVALQGGADSGRLTVIGQLSPRDAVIASHHEGLAINLADRTILLPSQTAEHLRSQEQCMTVHLGKRGCFVALHCDRWYPYSVIALSGGAEGKRWECDVWAGGQLLSASGNGTYHWVFMVEHEDELLVFGVSQLTVYVEGFRVDNGASTFRFGTIYGQLPISWGQETPPERKSLRGNAPAWSVEGQIQPTPCRAPVSPNESHG